ncbi:MAG: magnesium chelatase, partial [Candidatus Saccharibacteria bacterium]
RIDLQIEVPRVQYDHLADSSPNQPSSEMKAQIDYARNIQAERYAGRGFCLNAEMKPRDIRSYCKVDDDGSKLLRAAFKSLGLSARGYDRILKVARTIADLEGAKDISMAHVAEAIQYRGIERRYASAM